MPRVFGITNQKALLICVFLAQNDHGDYHSSEVIASTLGISKPHVSKLACLLSAKGILLGLRGHNGGYQLAYPPQNINLYDIFAAVSRDKMRMPRPEQRLGFNWKLLRPAVEAFKKKLESISLAEVAVLSGT